MDDIIQDFHNFVKKWEDKYKKGDILLIVGRELKHILSIDNAKEIVSRIQNKDKILDKMKPICDISSGKIEAMKKIRTAFGLGLAECKALVGIYWENRK